MASTLPDVLLGQWQRSPRLRGLVELIQDDRDDALAALDKIREMTDLDTAEGVWLDYLGARLGVPRPSTIDPSLDERFGYDMAGTGFDQRPFRGDTANDAVYPLPDGIYRRLLRSRVVLLFGDGTVNTLARAVAELDESATVQDQRNMTVRIVTSERTLIELADMSGALPRTAGVGIVYADRGRFGYDLAGVPFDQGPFA